MKYPDILKNWKVVMLLIFMIFSVVSIFSLDPANWSAEGVALRSVVPNSSASKAGFENPNPQSTPLQKERLLSINGKTINSVEDYFSEQNALLPNSTATIKTTFQTYTLFTPADESNIDLGLRIYKAPSSNIRKGLDLEGGTRVLLEPQKAVSEDDLQLTIDNLRERLNVYGLSDVIIRPAADLSGKDFILIEIAGVTEEEVKELLAKQGKFEAKIANEVVFSGGKKDITYVCRSANCAGIDPQRGCSDSADGSACAFFFSITLSPDAAKKHAVATRSLSVEPDGYLSEELVLFLDDGEVDRLRIAQGLKGREETQFQITGSGVGITMEDARINALANMNKLQTIIKTGSLPVKLDIAKLDTISPTLGAQFLDNILLVGALVILAVICVVGARYRKLKIVVPMVLTLLAELVLILGFASQFKWQLDLAGIAGILIVVGTGVDHLIIITDEILRGEHISDWKIRIKNAMFIVIGAYLTTLVGMIVLFWAGAGLLKGFALTTIAGISIGVLIARPAYAAVIEKLLNK